MTSVSFIFHDYLREMLKEKQEAPSPFQHHFERRASIKDVIESLGIPHPIIGSLRVNGKDVGFDYILGDNDAVEAAPLASPVNPFIPTLLRPQPLAKMAFVVDVNAGKLALLLRMLGFDTVYNNTLRDKMAAEIARSENRILLTRDTALLKRKIVMHGYLLRAQDPKQQVAEVVHLYDLGPLIKPLSRCMPCNGLLVPIAKEEILDRLEPLTREYYDSFYICKTCARIYWPGSHHDKLKTLVREVLESARQQHAGSL